MKNATALLMGAAVGLTAVLMGTNIIFAAIVGGFAGAIVGALLDDDSNTPDPA